MKILRTANQLSYKALVVMIYLIAQWSVPWYHKFSKPTWWAKCKKGLSQRENWILQSDLLYRLYNVDHLNEIKKKNYGFTDPIEGFTALYSSLNLLVFILEVTYKSCKSLIQYLMDQCHLDIRYIRLHQYNENFIVERDVKLVIYTSLCTKCLNV